MKGLFGGVSEEPVTYVNAPDLAKEHGVEIREVSCNTAVDYVNLDHHPRRRPRRSPAHSAAAGARPAS